MSAALSIRRTSPLADRYELGEGRVFLSGVQALVRLLIEQRWADSARGLRTATFVSGYPGSPLAGFDRELASLGPLAQAHDITLRPAVNEELGATSVWGSQLAAGLPGPRFDGVLGVWYGKAPGLDRAADAIRHGNFVGTDPRGGVLALCGDDPAAKSSTLPSASEASLAALGVPVFVPGSVQEALDLGRHAIACSRASGLWSALKLVADVADATATVDVGHERVGVVAPSLGFEGAPYVHRPSAHLLAPQSLELERSLVEVRLPLAKQYARVNGVNHVVDHGPRPWLGIVASGATAHDLRRSLADLGLDEGGPVRVLTMGMVFPFDEVAVRDLADGLDEVVVLEEKSPFLERLVRDALYGSAWTPPVFGASDERGLPLVPSHGTLGVDAISRIIGGRVLRRGEHDGVRARLAVLDGVSHRSAVDQASRRVPFFCSGCPHNLSTVAADNAIVGAGIGCHAMVVLSPERRGQVHGVTQMGGEGAQWIGVAPFTAVPHFVQNLGDGTFHHSGSLAVRAAVAAGLNITYKLLYNGYVAMTGGQAVEGQLSVEAIARSLEAEGVRRIVITAEDVKRYAGVALPAIASVRPRDALASVQRELASVPGVTVLIHDQACATELRRERKRGRAVDPPQRVMINERVCEGCGDCGTKSNCLSVEPVETEFGRKTRINQTTCNKDYSCLKGDCPSFLTVIPPAGAAAAANVRRPEIALPVAPQSAADDVRIRMVGIGGTGVVTVNQVLGMAAALEGRGVSGLDQTGLSQKAGPVVSDLRVTSDPVQEGSHVPAGSVDVLLGFDILGAAARRNLAAADPSRTVAVVSESVVPTGDMVVDVGAPAPDVASARVAISGATRADDNVYLDAQEMASRLLGDVTSANVIVLGAACQKGLLPVSAEALAEAFSVNGVAVERNLAALAWGRAWVVDSEYVRAQLGSGAAPPTLTEQERRLVDLACAAVGGELRRLVSIRVADLVGWGGIAAARRYASTVARVRAVEQERVPESTVVSEAVARGLHKLMAYKDEYEVARLHLEELERLERLEPGSEVRIHLHPPVLRALGLSRKLALGRSAVPLLRGLRASRRLRGTPLDPFGHTELRRLERGLSGEYMQTVDAALRRLGPDTVDRVRTIAELPELVRGYEEIKLEGVRRFRERGAELVAELCN